MRVLFTWLAAAIAVIAVLSALAIHTFEWNMLRGPVAEWVSQQTGREFAIDGDLEGSVSLQPWVSARDIRFANANWASEPDMVRVEHLEMRLDLRALARGRLVITELRLQGAEVHLEADGEGRVNWDLERIDRPDEPPWIPRIEELVVDESRLTYQDHPREIEMDAGLSSVGAISPDEGELPVSLVGEGRIQDRPFTLSMRGGSLLGLRDADEPFPFDLEAQVGDTELAMAGALLEFPYHEHIDAALHIEGPNAALLVPILQIPLPATPPYALSGRLVRNEDFWQFEDFDGTVGNSDLSGSLSVEADRERPLLIADLVSRNLEFRDLGALIGLPPDPGALQGEDENGRVRILPDAPLQVEQVQRNDARVTFRGERVLTRHLPVHEVELDLDLEDGVLQLTPLRFALAGGSLILFTSIYSGAEPVHTDLDLRLSDVRLRDVFEDTPLEGSGEGVLEGRARFSTSGKSIRSAMATATGSAALIMERGRIDDSLLRLLDVGFLEALAITQEDAEPDAMHIRCFVAGFDIEDGIMQTSSMILDTEDSLIAGEGAADLGDETFTLNVEGQSKDPGIARTRVPVQLSGTFTSVSVEVDPSGLVIRGGLAAGLAALVTPLAAVIPFIDAGLAEDSDCLRLMEEAAPEE